MNLKINIPSNSESQYVKSAVVFKDQYSLYGGWYTQVNDRFQEHKTV